MQKLHSHLLKLGVLLILYASHTSQVTMAQENFAVLSDGIGVNHFYGIGSSGGGISTVDFNQDGWDDLTFATECHRPIEFYLNDQGNFNLVTLEGIDNILETKQVLWVDFDNDGDLDFFASSLSGIKLYENDGALRFTDVTDNMNLIMNEPSYGAAWGDFNRDGWLDLYVTEKKVGSEFKQVSNHYFQNLQGNSFIELTNETNSADSSKAPFCGTFFDMNDDGWLDMYIAQDRFLINTMLKNMGDGTFRDISLSSNSNLVMNAMCVTVADYDNDMDFDIYVTNTPEGNALLDNLGNEKFEERAVSAGVGYFETGWSSTFLDFDNDGWQDLYVCGSFSENTFYKNLDGSTFEIEEDNYEVDSTAESYSSAVGDFNNDGKPDLIILNTGIDKSSVLMNMAESNNSWIKFNLEGTLSNKDGIGSRVLVYTGDNVYSRFTHSANGYLAQNSRNEHIGIGPSEKIDSLIIHWPSGVIDKHFNLDINTTHNFTESGTIDVPILNYSDTINFCVNGELHLNGSFFSDQLKYSWSNGGQGITTVAMDEGAYFLSIEDAAGNIFHSDTLFVNFVEGPEITESSINPISCHDGNDGEISIEIQGGVSPYDIIWTNGGDGLSAIGLTPGEIGVTIFDNGGCSIEETFDLENPSELIAYGARETDINNRGVGGILVIASGGEEPYTYSIDGSSETTESIFNDLFEGIYEITVKDAKGCITVFNVVVPNLTVTQADQQAETKVFPIPAKNQLYIKNATDSKVSIFDLAGNVIFNSKLNNELSIDVSHLANGPYLLQIGTERRMFVVRN